LTIPAASRKLRELAKQEQLTLARYHEIAVEAVPAQTTVDKGLRGVVSCPRQSAPG
jgi:hypothetical protein